MQTRSIAYGFVVEYWIICVGVAILQCHVVVEAAKVTSPILGNVFGLLLLVGFAVPLLLLARRFGRIALYHGKTDRPSEILDTGLPVVFFALFLAVEVLLFPEDDALNRVLIAAYHRSTKESYRSVQLSRVCGPGLSEALFDRTIFPLTATNGLINFTLEAAGEFALRENRTSVYAVTNGDGTFTVDQVEAGEFASSVPKKWVAHAAKQYDDWSEKTHVPTYRYGSETDHASFDVSFGVPHGLTAPALVKGTIEVPILKLSEGSNGYKTVRELATGSKEILLLPPGTSFEECKGAFETVYKVDGLFAWPCFFFLFVGGVGSLVLLGNAKRLTQEATVTDIKVHLGLTVGSVDSNTLQRFSLPSDAKGALIVKVAEGSVAERTGLRPGDLITSFGGKSIGSAEDLVNMLKSLRPGTQAKVSYKRYTTGTPISYTTKVTLFDGDTMS